MQRCYYKVTVYICICMYKKYYILNQMNFKNSISYVVFVGIVVAREDVS